MQEANSETVLGDFDDAEYEYFGFTSRFYRKDGKYFVLTDDAHGNPAEFEIKYTFGVTPLQQYLIEFDDGRVQALSIAWDTRPAEEGGQRWFHLYPDEHITHDDELHWTGHNQNWNFMCADCHSTNLRKNYDPESNTYSSEWSEIDVACEACHGPGSKHMRWAATKDERITDHGLLVDLKAEGEWIVNEQTGLAKRTALPANSQIETCARCHSRRITLKEEYVHGAPLTDSYRPQVLIEGLYFADGQIRDEVYVYGSFIQSRMFLNGVTCTDCHDPHSLKLKARGNALCAACHLPARFDTEKHHFHRPGTEAAQCVNCHMPARTYMVNDSRRDHSFRVPRPLLSEQVGAPDVCTECHQGRSGKWAAQTIRDHGGAGDTGIEHYGVALHAGQTGALDAEQILVKLVEDTLQPAIARATGALLLRDYLSPTSLRSIEALLRDPDPLVRANAVSALESLDPNLRVKLVAGLLTDPDRTVRAEAVSVLADVPGDALSAEHRLAFGAAIEEYIATQQANADRAESLTNLGNLYLRLGTPQIAQTFYQRAIDLHPAYVPAYVNLADLFRAQGMDEKAATLLKEAIDRYPEVGSLRHVHGLLLVRKQDKTAAMDELKRAVELEPENVRYRYVYAVALQSTGQMEAALGELRAAHDFRPADRDVLFALIDFNRRQGNLDQAREYAAKLAKRSPWDPNARALLQQLWE